MKSNQVVGRLSVEEIKQNIQSLKRRMAMVREALEESGPDDFFWISEYTLTLDELEDKIKELERSL